MLPIKSKRGHSFDKVNNLDTSALLYFKQHTYNWKNKLPEPLKNNFIFYTLMTGYYYEKQL
jgi:hypothetical protein